MAEALVRVGPLMMIVMLVGLCLLCFICGYSLGALSGAVAVADWHRDPLPPRRPTLGPELSIVVGTSIYGPCPGCGHPLYSGAAIARNSSDDSWWHRGCYSHAWMRGEIT